MENVPNLLCTASVMQSAIKKLAGDIYRLISATPADCALVGIHQLGVVLAAQIQKELKEEFNCCPDFGTLDISMYRDDFGQRTALPLIRETDISFDVDNARVILVDDVLSTGRTIRAALDAITDYGRPALIRLAVLIDRGGVEYPIRADYVGWELNCGADRKILVEFSEEDGADGVWEVAWKKHRA